MKNKPREDRAGGLEALFYPQSIALIGVPRGFKTGKLFLVGLLDQGFKGAIYPVNPTASEIDGLKAYPMLSAAPGPVDMAIVLTPKDAVWDVLDECAAKSVKVVVMYTSGFRESGTEQGALDEARLVRKARAGGFRLLGPNCMGVYSPVSGQAFLPWMPKSPGPVTFLSQSGSLTNLFTTSAAKKGIFMRHAVSFGNGADIDLPELLEAAADDDDASLVLVYCESPGDGVRLARALDRTTRKKPVVMWKVGMTDAGKKAAAGHTGSMAGSREIWEGVFSQFGVTSVKDVEEFTDTALAFTMLPPGARGNVAILSGPGGPAVSAADAVERRGLTLAPLSGATIGRLRSFLPAAGTSLINPVDVGLSSSFDISLYVKSAEALLDDPEVDAVVSVGCGFDHDSNKAYVEGLTAARKKSGKAVMAASFPGFNLTDDLLDLLHQGSVPAFTTPERAAAAYSRLVEYERHAQRMKKQY